MSEWIFLTGIIICVGLSMGIALYLKKSRRPPLSREEQEARDIQRVKDEVARWSRGMYV